MLINCESKTQVALTANQSEREDPVCEMPQLSNWAARNVFDIMDTTRVDWINEML